MFDSFVKIRSAVWPTKAAIKKPIKNIGKIYHGRIAERASIMKRIIILIVAKN